LIEVVPVERRINDPVPKSVVDVGTSVAVIAVGPNVGVTPSPTSGMTLVFDTVVSSVQIRLTTYDPVVVQAVVTSM
jgi:hypothetical protein